VAGDVGELGEVDAEQLHGRGEALFRRQVEDDGEIGRHGEPGVLGQLVLELAGGPAGVAEGDQHLAGLALVGEGLEHVAELVRPTLSLTLRVECQSPAGRCSTKPRSDCTGPPKYTGRSAKSGCSKGMSMRSKSVARRMSVGD
jgi:hypothetical protein